MTTATDVLKALMELGDSEDAIADKLIEAGCVGQIGSCSKCPLARYLVKRLGVVQSDVGDYVSVVNETGLLWTDGVHLPEACCDFVCNFDARKYPDLIELIAK